MHHIIVLSRFRTTKLTDSVHAVGKSKHTILDSATADALCTMLETLNLDDRYSAGTGILVHSKVLLNGNLVYSQLAKRVKRHNSFTVTFTDPQQPRQVLVGRIEKFITCPAESSSGVHVAVITPFEPLQKVHYPPEIRCIQEILQQDFVSGSCMQTIVVIPIENILMCFDASIPDFSVMTTCLKDYK